jgi:MYXO-CTERM domain-containing protein
MNKAALFLAAAGLCCAAALAGEWTWDFNGNLEPRDGIGDPLMPFGTTGFETDVIAGETAQVARFLGTDGCFRVETPVGANGGGYYVNIYTLIMDVKFPYAEWISLYQTHANPDGNDGDGFIRYDGGVGIAGDYTDDGNPLRYTYDAWHRLALVYDAARPEGDNEYAWYIDGELQNVVQGDFGIDGRWSLYPDGDSYAQWFYIFADDSGDTAEWGLVNSFQFRDYAATSAEIAELGGATANGIPEPAALSLLALGGLAALRRR